MSTNCANMMDLSLDSYYQDRRDLRCEVVLQNRDLWRKFYELGTEMIITKSGRRMFPSLRVQVQGLDPKARYCVLLELSPKTGSRYKYHGGWSPAGSAEQHSPHRVYLHPDSPATGAHWMSQTLNFNRLKLTNSAIPHPGHVVLSSMHKYQPRVLIVQAPDPRALPWAPSTSVSFPETQFIAVTAYQNDKITKLKIDNNPFAKGFRENGQSRSKRKRETKSDEIYPSTEQTAKKLSICSDESVTSSPEPSPKGYEPCLNIEQQYLPPNPVGYPPQWYSYPCPPMYKYPLEYDQYSYFPPQVLPTWPTPYPFPSYMAPPPMVKPQDLSSNQKPRKLTDFSIRAITES